MVEYKIGATLAAMTTVLRHEDTSDHTMSYELVTQSGRKYTARVDGTVFVWYGERPEVYGHWFVFNSGEFSTLKDLRNEQYKRLGGTPKPGMRLFAYDRDGWRVSSAIKSVKEINDRPTA